MEIYILENTKPITLNYQDIIFTIQRFKNEENFRLVIPIDKLNDEVIATIRDLNEKTFTQIFFKNTLIFNLDTKYSKKIWESNQSQLSDRENGYFLNLEIIKNKE